MRYVFGTVINNLRNFVKLLYDSWYILIDPDG